jgi:hypothetical protein
MGERGGGQGISFMKISPAARHRACPTRRTLARWLPLRVVPLARQKFTAFQIHFAECGTAHRSLMRKLFFVDNA